jgi:hypothetical protein
LLIPQGIRTSCRNGGSMCAVNEFRRTFKRVRRELSKTTCEGFAFCTDGFGLKKKIWFAMQKAHVPVTPGRVMLVNEWLQRASKLGGV